MDEIVLRSIQFPGLDAKYIIPDSAYKVTITDNGSVTADKTFADITTALAQGVFIFAVINGERYASYDKKESNTKYVFRSIVIGEDAIAETAYCINSNGTVSKASRSYTGGVEIDDTLSIEGAAADAQATGVALGDIGSGVVGLAETVGNKVDKVAGKGLSTNDYTDTDKAKVAAAITEHQSLAAYRTTAEQDVIDGGKVDKVNGAANGSLVYFDSNGGIKASGKNVVTTLGNNDYTVPTSKAVKDYVDAGGGGSDTLLVTVSVNLVPLAGLTVTSPSHTFAQILAAHSAGKFIELQFTLARANYRLPLTKYFDDNATSPVDFIVFEGNDGSESGGYSVKVTDADAWTISTFDYAEKSDLDDYVAISQGVAEAGKFLVVGDDGNVTTMTLAVWEGGSYGS